MPVFLRAVPVWAWAAGLVAVAALYLVGRRSVKPQPAQAKPQSPNLLQFASPDGTSGEVGLGGSPILNPSLAGQSGESSMFVPSGGSESPSSIGSFAPSSDLSTASYVPSFFPSYEHHPTPIYSSPTSGGGGYEPPTQTIQLGGDTGQGTGGVSAQPVAAHPGGSTPIFQGSNARLGGGPAID